VNIIFSEDAWDDYIYWQTQDKKTLKRINSLIESITRDPFNGTGKSEPLKHDLSGCWSRRIDDVNRVTYTVSSDSVKILRCKGHYKKK